MGKSLSCTQKSLPGTLVTEGSVTLAKAPDLLERGVDNEPVKKNLVRDLIALMPGERHRPIVVGTRIKAHRDPNVPIELDLRRNSVADLYFRPEWAWDITRNRDE